MQVSAARYGVSDYIKVMLSSRLGQNHFHAHPSARIQPRTLLLHRLMQLMRSMERQFHALLTLLIGIRR
jgi:hypothetical protein